MDSSSLASSFNDPHPQISRILARVHQLAIEDEWIKDYYLTSSLPQTAGNHIEKQNSPNTTRKPSTIMSSGKFI